MVRLAVAALSVVLLCAAAYFAPWPWLAAFWPGSRRRAAVFGHRPHRLAGRRSRGFQGACGNTGKLRDDILLLARSIDVALRDVAARTDKETATISEMSGAVAREIDRLSERIADARRHRRHAGRQMPTMSCRIRRRAARAPQPAFAEARRRRPTAAPSKQRTARRSRPASSTSRCSRSSRCRAAPPAASRCSPTCRSRAASASIFAGRRNAARRRSGGVRAHPGHHGAEAGRKRLGAASAAMPLHVAISDAILADARELAPLLDMLQFYPDLAGSIVLSMPSGLFDAAGVHAQALGLLSAKGVRFAGEGWNETADGAASIGGRRPRLPEDPGQPPARPRKAAPQAGARRRRSSKARRPTT